MRRHRRRGRRSRRRRPADHSGRHPAGGDRRAGAAVEGRVELTRPAPLRVGLYGLFGSTNIGNDGSLEALVRWLARSHPEAVVECRCPGDDVVRARLGIATSPMYWLSPSRRPGPTLLAAPVKVLAKFVDAGRTLAWVRRQDVVIVPGTGILEATLPLRPW